MAKRILMIAYHFPPLQGSSGLHRTLTFSRHLLEDHGWEPTVLTVHPRAYPRTSGDMLADVAPGVEVIRAFGLDTSRHLSILGRYPLFLALPDTWATWWIGGTRAGMRHIRRARPDVIWATFPIATAVKIGLSLHRRSGIPLVVDFRDSMTEDHYPQPRRKWKSYRAIEGAAVRSAALSVFTTPGARAMYRERYPDVAPERWAVIANGYDETPFADAEAQASAPRAQGPRTLVHAGLLSRSERDPRPFFAALGRLKAEGRVSARDLRVVLRASGDEEYHREWIGRHDVADLVSLEDPLPYREALAEMLGADGLLLFQASNCNHQIPAKAYEYLRARRPILALTDPAGDTAALLRDAGAGTIVRLDSEEDIAAGLRGFLEELNAGTVRIATPDEVDRHSRRARAAELARRLEATQGA